MRIERERTEPERFASRLREQVLRPDAVTPVGARTAAFDGSTTEPSVNDVTGQIRRDAREVTDEQIRELVRTFGSEAGAFEIIMAATIGAGLGRWDAALSAIESATDATS